jgi:hypothetical protein
LHIMDMFNNLLAAEDARGSDESRFLIDAGAH